MAGWKPAPDPRRQPNEERHVDTAADAPQRVVAPASAGPAISVVIPTYNRAALIGQTLDSVRAQTFTDWECVVVDDGSTDDTAAVVARVIEGDPRFRYVRQQRSTASAARNRGVRESRGRYVAFLDSDDLFPADRLAWQFRELEAEPSAVFAYGDSYCFDGGDLNRTVSYMENVKQLPSGWAFEALIQCGCVAAPLVRREAVLRSGGFDETLATAEDWDLWLSLSKIGTVIYRPRPSLLIRRHPGNKSANILRNYRGVDRVARKQLRDQPLWTRVRLYRAARRFFRSGWLDRMLADANVLNDQDDWVRARLVWRAVAHLDPRQLGQLRVLLNVFWSLVPTNAPPPWRTLWRRFRRGSGGRLRRRDVS